MMSFLIRQSETGFDHVVPDYQNQMLHCNMTSEMYFIFVNMISYVCIKFVIPVEVYILTFYGFKVQLNIFSSSERF